jgi:hypothetical protein
MAKSAKIKANRPMAAKFRKAHPLSQAPQQG